MGPTCDGSVGPSGVGPCAQSGALKEPYQACWAPRGP